MDYSAYHNKSVEMNIASSASQLKDFIKYSPIWKDIKNELNIMLSEIHLQLENEGELHSHQKLDHLGGSAKALRVMLALPENILINLEMDKGE